jgi:hypothetical protein
MTTRMPCRIARALARCVLVVAALAALPVAAQAPWPAPGVSNLDTNTDGTNDLALRRIDTDADGIADQVHVDNDNDGVVDPGERVFNHVIGYTVIGGAAGFTITIVEDTGTEKVKTVLEPFDKTGDGDCDDAGEVIQRNSMPDSMATVQINLFGQPPLVAQLQGSSHFAADLNRIVAVGGVDTIPIELVALSLSGGPQPITIRLNPNPPSFGSLVETVNVVAGNMDGRLIAPGGAFDSFFDVHVDLHLHAGTGDIVVGAPLRMYGPAGTWPPAPLQQYSLANPGIPLFDAATMQPIGTLERLDWTPHVAPRLDCNCDRVSVMPIIRTHKAAGQTVVDSPDAGGAINGDDARVYDVEIEIEWAVGIKCSGPGTGCEATFAPAAASANWVIDDKPSAPVGLDSHEGAGAGGITVCNGVCEQEISVAPPPVTTYKVSVKKGAGGIITTKVSGVITLVMGPRDCTGDPWRMVLVYEADIRKGEVRIDPLLSNWDGDKKINAADKNPLDPKKN